MVEVKTVISNKITTAFYASEFVLMI